MHQESLFYGIKKRQKKQTKRQRYFPAVQNVSQTTDCTFKVSHQTPEAEINPAPHIQVAKFIRPDAIFSHVAFYAFHFSPSLQAGAVCNMKGSSSFLRIIPILMPAGIKQHCSDK